MVRHLETLSASLWRLLPKLPADASPAGVTLFTQLRHLRRAMQVARADAAAAVALGDAGLVAEAHVHKLLRRAPRRRRRLLLRRRARRVCCCCCCAAAAVAAAREVRLHADARSGSLEGLTLLLHELLRGTARERSRADGRASSSASRWSGARIRARKNCQRFRSESRQAPSTPRHLSCGPRRRERRNGVEVRFDVRGHAGSRHDARGTRARDAQRRGREGLSAQMRGRVLALAARARRDERHEQPREPHLTCRPLRTTCTAWVLWPQMLEQVA